MSQQNVNENVQQKTQNKKETSPISPDDNVELPDDLIKYLQMMKNKVHDAEKNSERNFRSQKEIPCDFDLSQNERLWLMKNKDEFIDSVIVTADGNYQEKVHMDLLLLLDKNIQQAFKYTKDLNPMVKEYQIEPYISAEVLKQVVCFAYKKHMQLNEENSIEIGNFSAKYRIVPLVNYCLKYFQKNCTILNVLKGYELSMKFCEDTLIQYFKSFIGNNFQEIVLKMKMELLKLDNHLIIDILTSSKLDLVNEEVVWDLIYQWILYDRSDRFKYMEEFLGKVLRFGRLREDFLNNQVMGSELFKDLPLNIQTHVFQWMNEQGKQGILIRDGYGLNYSKQLIYFQPRETKELLLVAGGWVEGATTSSLELYDYQTNLWLQSPIKLHRKISYFGLEIIDDTIYVFGGSNGREIFKTLYACNLDDPQRRWVQKCSMVECRCYVSSATLNGMIYAIGGFNQQTRVRRCECYNPQLNCWREIADLNYPRSDASVVVHNGKIYIAGGINNACIERSVEVYYPEDNHWRLVKSMKTPRTSFAMASFQNKIWALGGNDGIKRSDTVECYDTEEDKWTEQTNMLIKRSTFRTMVLRNELYVVGGYNGQSPICDVEKFVPGKGWTKVKPMRHDRSGLSILCIPNKFNSIKI